MCHAHVHTWDVQPWDVRSYSCGDYKSDVTLLQHTIIATLSGKGDGDDNQLKLIQRKHTKPAQRLASPCNYARPMIAQSQRRHATSLPHPPTEATEAQHYPVAPRGQTGTQPRSATSSWALAPPPEYSP